MTPYCWRSRVCKICFLDQSSGWEGDAEGVIQTDDLDRAETLHPRTKTSHVSAHVKQKARPAGIPMNADSCSVFLRYMQIQLVRRPQNCLFWFTLSFGMTGLTVLKNFTAWSGNHTNRLIAFRKVIRHVMVSPYSKQRLENLWDSLFLKQIVQSPLYQAAIVENLLRAG